MIRLPLPDEDQAVVQTLRRDPTLSPAERDRVEEEQHDIGLSTRQTRKERGRIAGWRRTARTLRHQQDPAKVERAKVERAKVERAKVERAKTVRGSLKQRPPLAASGLCISTSAALPPASR